jgi:hypothetical protein
VRGGDSGLFSIEAEVGRKMTFLKVWERILKRSLGRNKA